LLVRRVGEVTQGVALTVHSLVALAALADQAELQKMEIPVARPLWAVA
jgi:hypothetical protein